jgi:hypothetical protein
MYRRINPLSQQGLPMRMLFQPLGDGTYHRASEADGFRGLVAALLDDPTYETWDVESRLMSRLRLADELVLLAQVEDEASVRIGDRDADRTINVASDERFIRSIDRMGFVSLDPGLPAQDKQAP